MAGPDRFIDKEALQIWDHLEVFILIDRVSQTDARTPRLFASYFLFAMPAQKCQNSRVSFVAIDPSKSRAERVIKGTRDTLGTF